MHSTPFYIGIGIGIGISIELKFEMRLLLLIVKYIVWISFLGITLIILWGGIEIGMIILRVPPIRLMSNKYFIPNTVRALTRYSLDLQLQQKNSSVNKKIPRIIHQTWKTQNLSTFPGYNSHYLWKELYERRGYQIILWTDNMIEQLIHSHYPFLISVYQSFPYNIQRADLARYIIIHNCGGYYADLDTFPNALSLLNFSPFNLILPYNALTHSISNHFIAAQKHSPFLWHVLTAMRNRSSGYIPLSPYFQVFVTSGPFFLQNEFVQYFSQSSASPTEAIALLPNEVSKKYFYHIGGRSWHQWDGSLFNFFGDHILFFSILLFFISIGIIRRILSCNSWRRNKTDEYGLIKVV